MAGQPRGGKAGEGGLGGKQEKYTLRLWAFGELLFGGESHRQRHETILGAKDQERDSKINPEIRHSTET